MRNPFIITENKILFKKHESLADTPSIMLEGRSFRTYSDQASSNLFRRCPIPVIFTNYEGGQKVVRLPYLVKVTEPSFP